MPLPEYPPALVHVPAWAGIGLRIKPRTAEPDWPVDWWQRNCDEVLDDPCPTPLTERQKHVPVAP